MLIVPPTGWKSTYVQAFPAVAATAVTVQDVAAPWVASLPAGIAAGNLLLVGVTTFDTSSASTVAAPAGWNTVLDHAGASFVRRLTWFWKIADGSEGASVTITTTGTVTNFAAISYRITGHHPSTAPEGAAFAISGGSGGSTSDPPNLAPTWGSAKTLWLAGFAKAGTTAPSATPANYTNLIGTAPAATGAMIFGMQRQLEAASENPGTFSQASAREVAYTLGIRPA